MSDRAQIDRYAARVLITQDVLHGSVAMNRDGKTHPVPPLHVAAVLHALADHTHNKHMLYVAEERLMARPTDPDWEPGATSLGRYFHALADAIEDEERRW